VRPASAIQLVPDHIKKTPTFNANSDWKRAEMDRKWIDRRSWLGAGHSADQAIAQVESHLPQVIR
jgi:hypothetical protein